MEKIYLKKMMITSNKEIHNVTQSFIVSAFSNIRQYISMDLSYFSLGDAVYFANYYNGHSGHKYLGGMGYSIFDGCTLVDDDGYECTADENTLADGEAWAYFANAVGPVIAGRFGRKWTSIVKSVFNNYQSDISDEETYSETITNDLKDSKSYGKTNRTERSTDITSDDTGTDTDQVSAFNSNSFQDVNKTTSEGNTHTTADPTSNYTSSSDSGTDTLSHTGTRTREVSRTGRIDKWKRGEEQLRFISADFFEIMAKDIDSVITLPYYSLD